MENKYFDDVIKEMTPFIEENGFKETERGVYTNDKKSFKVSYKDESQMYGLNIADIGEDNTVGEYVESDSWLFDDTQNAKDAVSVGMDFVDVLKKNMGIKSKPVVSSDVELPSTDSEKYTISTFAKKVLDTYPQLKDTYKEYVARYGSFLYLNFFGEYLVPLMIATVNEKTKKSAKKILDLIEPAFIKGDADSSNAAIACISAVYVKDPGAEETIMDILADNSSLKLAVSSFVSTLKSNKKLKSVLIK